MNAELVKQSTIAVSDWQRLEITDYARVARPDLIALFEDWLKANAKMVRRSFDMYRLVTIIEWVLVDTERIAD